MTRPDLAHVRRWVVKLGSSLLTADGRGLNAEAVAGWAAQIAGLRAAGHEVVVVSSGAVAAGMTRLGLTQRPPGLAELQAAAAVGQLGVARLWQEALAVHGVQAGQVLLTHEDAADRQRFLNARNTLRALLAWQVVPVVNENDTVATEEIRFGDNDTLAAVTADLCSAELLVILTDQAGVFDADPRLNPQARLIGEVQADDEWLDRVAGVAGGALGRGGMQSKILAARMAARSGIPSIIAGGHEPDVLRRIAAGEALGTYLAAGPGRLRARKRWIAAQRRAPGTLRLDAGAARALRAGGRSLLPVGVTAVEGRFARGDLVSCVDPDGVEVARGLSNYDAADARRLCGVPSARIIEVLNRPGEAELVHRDNMVVVGLREGPRRPASSAG